MKVYGFKSLGISPSGEFYSWFAASPWSERSIQARCYCQRAPGMYGRIPGECMTTVGHNCGIHASWYLDQALEYCPPLWALPCFCLECRKRGVLQLSPVLAVVSAPPGARVVIGEQGWKSSVAVLEYQVQLKYRVPGALSIYRETRDAMTSLTPAYTEWALDLVEDSRLEHCDLPH